MFCDLEGWWTQEARLPTSALRTLRASAANLVCSSGTPSAPRRPRTRRALTIGYYVRRFNVGRRPEDHGLRFTFTDTRTLLEPVELVSRETLAAGMSVRDRLFTILRGGKRTHAELEAELSKTISGISDLSGRSGEHRPVGQTPLKAEKPPAAWWSAPTARSLRGSPVENQSDRRRRKIVDGDIDQETAIDGDVILRRKRIGRRAFGKARREHRHRGTSSKD